VSRDGAQNAGISRSHAFSRGPLARQQRDQCVSDGGVQVRPAGGAQPGKHRLAHKRVSEHEDVWCVGSLGQQTGGRGRFERIESCHGIAVAAGTVDDVGPELAADDGGGAQRQCGAGTETVHAAL